jgi:hypothetical protein
MPQSGANAAGTDSTTLQNQIQTALKNEPTLANDNISVNVTDNAIDLSGTAASRKERMTARRIALSYANNRKVQDHITVAGAAGAPAATQPDATTPRPEDKNNQNQTPPPDQSTPK